MTAAEGLWQEHLNSYDHHHKKRFAEFKEVMRFAESFCCMSSKVFQ
jgi:hypothetical protein